MSVRIKQFVLKEAPDIVLLRDCRGVLSTNVPYVKHLHSKSFETGYGGSGPADLALNILLMFTDEKLAYDLHQDFKWEFIAKIKVPANGSDVITAQGVKNFIRKKVGLRK